ncbi:hypothetical protein [Metapseudomonas lalkuanensis]|uniref:hypothetical protein n=1 Tax=Metapseudomonas lalkuanensis TaxID=2604832 RepID=UPI00299D2B65|nr:hypothetical protein [Pseudomonas lalkuanensis]
MNKSMQTLTAAALAFALLAPAAWAGQDDQTGHQKSPSSDAGQMNHGQMNHGQMDHSQMQGMDHSQMKAMDHSKMDHGAMHKDAKPKAESNDDR